MRSDPAKPFFRFSAGRGLRGPAHREAPGAPEHKRTGLFPAHLHCAVFRRTTCIKGYVAVLKALTHSQCIHTDRLTTSAVQVCGKEPDFIGFNLKPMKCAWMGVQCSYSL